MQAHRWLSVLLFLAASNLSQAAPPAESPFANSLDSRKFLKNARGALNPLRTLIGMKSAPAPRNTNLFSPPERAPADLLVIRVSRRVLEQHIERNVVREDPINDYILGTQIRGTARVRGTSQLTIEDNDSQAVIHAVFAGTIRSQTAGYNGPVVLQSHSSTPFHASTQIILGPQGMQVSPTSVEARTMSHTTAIDAHSAGVRGRLTERVAWKRSNQLRHQADAIGSRHAAEQIRQAFDKEVREVTELIQTSLLAGIPQLTWEDDPSPLAARFRSALGYVEIVLYRPDATLDERAISPPPIAGDPAIAVRAYRGVLMQAVTAANLKQMLQPLISGSIMASQTDAKPEHAAYDVRWSADGNWLAFDHTDSPQVAGPATRVTSAQTVVAIPGRLVRGLPEILSAQNEER